MFCILIETNKHASAGFEVKMCLVIICEEKLFNTTLFLWPK